MKKQEFDEYIEGYRSNCDHTLRLSGETSSYFAKYKAQKLAEWFPNLTTQRCDMLDFGCGDGVMTNFVRETFPKAQVSGTDPSPKSIETAKKNFPRIEFSINSDEKTELAFESKRFEIIFAAGAFHHIPFHLHTSYVEELCRILTPSGHLVLFELNPLNPLTTFTFKRSPIDKNATMMKPWYSYRLLRKYGKTKTKFYCFYPNMLRWLRFTEPYMTKFPFGALYATIMNRCNPPLNN